MTLEIKVLPSSISWSRIKGVRSKIVTIKWIRLGHPEKIAANLRLIFRWGRQCLRLLKLALRRRSDAEQICFEYEIITPYLKWQTNLCNRLCRHSQFRTLIDDEPKPSELTKVMR